MVRLLKFLLLLPVAALVVGLAVINRGSIKLVYWPAQFGSELSLALPLFVALFAALLLGVVIGGCASWFGELVDGGIERNAVVV